MQTNEHIHLQVVELGAEINESSTFYGRVLNPIKDHNLNLNCVFGLNFVRKQCFEMQITRNWDTQF